MNMFKSLSSFVKHLILSNNLPLRKMSVGKSNLISSIEDSAAQRMVWVDMELTGLDFKKDVILEIACVITEADLSIVAQAPLLIIHQPEHVLHSMNEWCMHHHSKTGLIEESLKSTLNEEQADQLLYDFVAKYTPHGKCCVAGNSVYCDRWHMMKYLPKFNSHLHYRIIDVSTIKELCRRWRRDKYAEVPKKEYLHRATEDIFESIEEMKHYQRLLFQ